MKKNIVIIDYGVGNTHSVMEALAALGEHAQLSNDPDKMSKADALVLPGVGAFEAAMNNLNERNLVEPLNDLVLDQKKPILGICLGMQLLANHSEENGLHDGLGWIGGRVIRISGPRDLRVPHVGWNDIDIINRSPLFDRLNDHSNFYFDHSFHFKCNREEDIAARVNYGVPLVAAVKKDHVHGVQFHPEKSQLNGLRLIKGFLNSIN